MKNWDDLRIVLAVARHGGLSSAASALKVSHTTLSRRITALETTAGVRLFDRLPGGFRPTGAGRQAVQAAEVMEEAALALYRQTARQDQDLAGDITLALPLMLASGPMAAMFDAFGQEYPDIRLNVLCSNDLISLHRRDADLVVRVTSMADQNLFGLKLTEMQAAVYASPAYLHDHRDMLALPPGQQHLHWIGFPDQDGPAMEIHATHPGLRQVIGLDDKIAMQAAARAGMGLVRLPCYAGDRDDQLCRVPGFGQYAYPDLWLLTHQDLKQVARIRVLMRYLSARVRRMRPLFMGELGHHDTGVQG